MEKEESNKKRILIIVGVAALLLLFILPAKFATRRHINAEADTTADSYLYDAEGDSIALRHAAGADTASHVDSRPADRMGEEDGYRSGMFDGAMKSSQSRSDDKGPQRDAAGRKTYSDSYRQGYQKGLQQGRESEQIEAKDDNRTIEEMADAAASSIAGSNDRETDE